MSLLLKTALQNRTIRLLLALSVALMCLSTFANQLEMFAIGVITKSGTNASVAKEGTDMISKGLHVISHYLQLEQNVRHIGFFLLGVALFKAIALFSYRYITRLVAIAVSRDLRQRYFEHMQSLPIAFFHKYSSGSLSTRVVGDAALVAEATNASLVNYCQTPFTVMTTLILCFLTSWHLSLVIFLGFPLIIAPILFLAKKVKKISKQIQHNQERFTSVLIDFLAGIQTVKVFAMEEFSLLKYRQYNDQMAHLEKHSARYDLASRPIVHTIGMLCLATALMYGIYFLHMEIADVLFYCGLLYIFYEPIKKFAEENSHIQRGIAAAERMQEIMSLQPDLQDAKDAQDLSAFEESIEFQDVWFRYDDACPWALKGVSLSFKKGETVAIVGATGAGKSTLVQLLPRLYDVQKGQIRIDGKPLTSFTQKSLREMIAYVPQKPFLFLDTVANNIAYGKEYSIGQISQAAMQAHADEFIVKLPEGYHTQLVETGKNLSGGQQQRLSIARALVKKAPILIMDEATSALDPISENRIKDAMQDIQGKITQIIIAHRLSTIENADRIIQLENGEKIAEGTFQELLMHSPSFRKMWELMHVKNES